ncbi:MAG: tRNA pseudouridine(55) synthase TruB [Pseudomonadota bacterium]|nr:tRNA pseudouridine(55) synthase TruB [Pseudomonadota bacterium]
MSKRTNGRDLNGILIVDKPQGLSSNGVVSRLKRWSQAKKVGHTGALDPMATGVLPIVFGEATKFSQYGLNAHKGYLARIQLGSATDTLDAEGNIILVKPIPELTESKIATVLSALTGTQMQVPPMVSALKHQGQPLYKLARQGKEVQRSPRPIQIFSNNLLQFDVSEGWIDICVRCSKGTYIRSLAESIGDALGSVAHLSRLRRDLSGGFSLEQALAWSELESLQDNDSSLIDSSLLPIDAILSHFPRVDLTEDECTILIQGQKVSGKRVDVCDNARAYFAGGPFIGIVSVQSSGMITAKRMLSPAAAGMRGRSDFGQ